MSLSGATTVAGVIGDPVAHSLSPAVHNAAFAATGLDWVYVAFRVPSGKGESAVEAMRALGLGGLSVTTPHKDVAARAADTRSAAVEVLGAANCLVPMGDGRVRAENTDGAGFLRGLSDDAHLDVAGRTVAVVGAGGAARAVAQACGEAGADTVLVVNRTQARAETCAALAGAAGKVAGPGDVATADVVVNATTLGMGSETVMPCDPKLLHGGQVVVDLIYEPLETPWLAAARRAGVEAHNGVSMLIHQAAAAFALWTGMDAPLEVMRQAVERNLA